jgi:hypothetical protein
LVIWVDRLNPDAEAAGRMTEPHPTINFRGATRCTMVPGNRRSGGDGVRGQLQRGSLLLAHPGHRRLSAAAQHLANFSLALVLGRYLRARIFLQHDVLSVSTETIG